MAPIRPPPRWCVLLALFVPGFVRPGGSPPRALLLIPRLVAVGARDRSHLRVGEGEGVEVAEADRMSPAARADEQPGTAGDVEVGVDLVDPGPHRLRCAGRRAGVAVDRDGELLAGVDGGQGLVVVDREAADATGGGPEE